MMIYLAIPEHVDGPLREDLLGAAPLEAGTFSRLHRIVRGDRSRLVLGTPIESAEPWRAQRHNLLAPTGRRISAAVSIATAEQCGLAFIHSHPRSRYAHLSGLDRETTIRLGRTFRDLLDTPFASLVVSPTDWGGALADGERLLPLDRIATVGRGIRMYGATASDVDAQLDDRQIRAIGEAGQKQLRSLRVGIIGAGGLGSPVAETLVRMGVGEVRLMDPDNLDTLSNARRVFGVTRRDAESRPPRAKAEAVAESLNELDLGANVVPIVGDVRGPTVQAALLDVDVIVSGTDTHSSRASLTELAVRAAVPLIDVGVRVGTRRDGQLDALRLERRIQVPGGPCLWCWGTLDAEEIRVELMPTAQREQLSREGYLTGSPNGPIPSVAALTVTAAGTATSALLGMLCGALDHAPLGVGIDALSLDSAPLSREVPDPDCICARWRAGVK